MGAARHLIYRFEEIAKKEGVRVLIIDRYVFLFYASEVFWKCRKEKEKGSEKMNNANGTKQTRFWRFHSRTIGSTSKHMVRNCSCCTREVGSEICSSDVTFGGHFLRIQYCCHVAAFAVPWEGVYGVFGYVSLSLFPFLPSISSFPALLLFLNLYVGMKNH
jgi:hypothetical protein